MSRKLGAPFRTYEPTKKQQQVIQLGKDKYGGVYAKSMRASFMHGVDAKTAHEKALNAVNRSQVRKEKKMADKMEFEEFRRFKRQKAKLSARAEKIAAKTVPQEDVDIEEEEEIPNSPPPMPKKRKRVPKAPKKVSLEPAAKRVAKTLPKEFTSLFVSDSEDDSHMANSD